MPPTQRLNSRASAREWLVALSGGLTLAFTAWGLGGIPTWSLHTLLAGGTLTLALALLPLPRKWLIAKDESRSIKHEARSINENDRLKAGLQPTQRLDQRQRRNNLTASGANAQRLLRWPFFWFSLAFLLYLLIGALNPAAQVVTDERGWWVEAIQPKLAVWLPTSVASDYQPMNAWRVLASFTASFTLVWGLWAGLTRRAPVLLVLWCLLLSGAGMGLVGILQHLSEAKAVLWTFPSSNLQFWGSFFYRNQGAAYLNLILVLAGVLFFYHGVKTRQKARSGGPHFLCFLLFALTAASVGLALSRGGILFAGILCVAFLALLMVFLLQGLWHLSSIWSALIPLVLLTSAALLAMRYVDLDAIEQRFGDIEATIESVDQDARAFSTKATWDMARDRLWQGWGAGSFRYIFPMYQREYPEIYYRYFSNGKKRPGGRQLYRYAHNDLLQFVAEYGQIGCGLLVLAFASMLLPLLAHLRYSFFAISYLMFGFVASMAHAFLDFIFNSPAYWMAFVGLLVVVTKLLKLESQRGRNRAA